MALALARSNIRGAGRPRSPCGVQGIAWTETVPVGSAKQRAEVLRSFRSQSAEFLAREAPGVNAQTLWMIAHEMLKNGIDHNDRGATLSLWVESGRLQLHYHEPAPPVDDCPALLARFGRPEECAEAGNGINFGIGLSLMYAAAEGLAMTLYAAVPGALLHVCGPGRLLEARAAAVVARDSRFLVYRASLSLETNRS